MAMGWIIVIQSDADTTVHVVYRPLLNSLQIPYSNAGLPLSSVAISLPSSILPHCHKQNDRDFGKQCLDFVAHVTRLIELVIDFRNVPSDDYNKDNRMGCMFNLLVGDWGWGRAWGAG